MNASIIADLLANQYRSGWSNQADEADFALRQASRGVTAAITTATPPGFAEAAFQIDIAGLSAQRSNDAAFPAPTMLDILA